MLSRFIFKNYRQDYIPTYEDNFQTSAFVDGMESDIEILDTPGSEEVFYNLFIKDQLNQSMKQSRISNLDAYILAYDTTNLESFKALEALH